LVTGTSAAPLAGLRVLDFTQFLSGPYCTQMLADLGAQVIKVEAPQGDFSRSIPPNFVDSDSVYFISINRNKRSIAVDTKTVAGADLVRRLILENEIIVENFRPGVLDRLGLSVDKLRAEKPELIWCSITGFGQSGPYRDKPAYDMIVQALSGGMSLTGEPGRSAVRAGIPIGDIAAGMYAATAILAALQRRHVTGRGDYIDISMLDCQAAMLSYQGAYYLHSGKVPDRQGTSHDSIPTYRAFTARDGIQIVITANTERMWQGLCRTLGLPDLADNPEFKTNRERYVNRVKLWPILEAAFLSRSSSEWVSLLEKDGIPVAVVNTLDRVMEDPQLNHRGMIMEIPSSSGKKARVMGNPMLFHEAGKPPSFFPPRLGENTDDILHNILGIDGAKIEALKQAGVVVGIDSEPPIEAI